MNFLADENTESAIVNALRADGHNVVSVAEDFPSVDDSLVLNFSHLHDIVLLTADKDFGDLVYRQQRKFAGVLLLRLFDLPLAERIVRIRAVVNLHGQELPGAFAVLTSSRLRIRKSILQ